MADLSLKARNSIALQQDVFRLAERDYGLSITILARTRDIPAATIRGWKNGSAMPAWALGELGLPDELASMLLDPYQKHVGTNGSDDGDLDELAEEAAEFVADYTKARSPKSPGGLKIVPQERAHLADRAHRLEAKARRAAA